MSASTKAVERDLAGAAKQWLDENGLPNRHIEAWKYTPIAEIASKLEGAGAPSVAAALSEAELIELVGQVDGPRLVFINGFYSDALSVPLSSQDAEVGVLNDEPNIGLAGEYERYDGYQALNHMDATATATISIQAQHTVDKPIHLVYLTTPQAEPTLVQPRTVVEVADGASATLIESFVSTTGAVFSNASTIVSVSPNASLTHIRVQSEGSDATHVGHTRVTQAKESTYSSVSIMLGAKFARHALDVTLEGDSTQTNLDGLFMPTGEQRHDNMLTIDHAGSFGNSDQNYKGVVGGRGRGSFSGHVIVRENTAQNNADQSNRNLLLAPSAQADTRPWLEIFADEVQCTHGATVGRIDDEALFYLRSRGIPLEEAKSVLIEAFVHEISDEIVPESLREHLLGSIDERIEVQQ